MKNALGAGLVGAFALTIVAEAAAQEAASASDTQLEAIVVTSQKRREDVKEIPVSVSSISGETLKDNQIVDFTDLSRNIPNVSFMSQAGAGLSTIEIRGVSSQAGSATVGVYLDDVSLTTRNLYSQGTAEPRFFDINRVEVLRGPQGTLYGAGSMGGTIRFIGNQPDPSGFAGNASAQVSETEHGGTNYEANAVLNLPLSAISALRVGVEEGHDSGYIDQVNPNSLQVIDKGINSNSWSVEKAALKTKIGSDWTVTPSIFAQQYRSADIDAAYLYLPSYQVGNGQTGTSGPNLGLFQTSKIMHEPGDDRLTVISADVNGDLHFADFTAVLSNYKRLFNRIQDGTFVNSNYVASLVNPAYPALIAQVNGEPSPVYLDNSIRSNSVEMRLASKDYDASQSMFTWVGGFYFSRTKTDVYDNEPINGITAAFANAGVSTTDPNILGGAFAGDFGPYPYGSANDSSYFSARHYDDAQKSLFGELTTHFGPTLRMLTGLRWVDATENFDREGAYYFTGAPGLQTAVVTANSTAFTPHFALDWDIDASNTGYVNIAKGFRVGGANRPIPNVFLQQGGFTEPSAFKPDSLWSYELGTKSRLLDKRLNLNMAVYYIDWKSIQQDVQVPGGYDFETNVGRAIDTGAEFDLTYRVMHGLTLSAAGNWTRAVFAEDVPAVGATSGQAIQGVPKFSFHLGVEDRFPVTADLAGVARLNGNWTGTSYGTWITSSPDYLRPQYFTADCSAGVSFGRWEVGAFVKNLNNNHTVIQQMAIQFLPEALYLRPRTIGLNVTGEF